MTTHSLGNLAIKRFVSPDGNFFNPDRIQVSDAPRRTEYDAEQLLRYGRPIPATQTHMYNGQSVDVTTMLMCSRCCAWKKDNEFAKDRTRSIRRGRRYYCSDCLKRMRY